MMKLKFKQGYITKLIMLLVLLIGIGGCVNDTLVPQGDEAEENVTIELVLNGLGYNLPLNEATRSYMPDENVGREIQVYVFDADTEELKDSGTAFQSSNSNRYKVVLKEIEAGKLVNLVLAANSSEYLPNNFASYNELVNNIKPITKRLDNSGQNTNLNVLPLWAELKNQSITKGTTKLSVNFVRSVAKFSIVFDSSIKNGYDTRNIFLYNKTSQVNIPFKLNKTSFELEGNPSNQRSPVADVFPYKQDEWPLDIPLAENEIGEAPYIIIEAGKLKTSASSYYKLNFKDAIRNTHYMYHVSSLGNGFDNIADAIKSDGRGGKVDIITYANNIRYSYYNSGNILEGYKYFGLSDVYFDLKNNETTPLFIQTNMPSGGYTILPEVGDVSQYYYQIGPLLEIDPISKLSKLVIKRKPGASVSDFETIKLLFKDVVSNEIMHTTEVYVGKKSFME